MIIELVDNTLDSDEEVAALGQLFTICITAPEVVKKKGAQCLFCTSIVAEACRTHVLNNRRCLPGFLTNLDIYARVTQKCISSPLFFERLQNVMEDKIDQRAGFPINIVIQCLVIQELCKKYCIYIACIIYMQL